MGTDVLEYTMPYLQSASKPAISLTLPKSQKSFQSAFLFPVFAHLLAEGRITFINHNPTPLSFI